MNTFIKSAASLLLFFGLSALSAQVLVNNSNLVVNAGGELIVSGTLVNGSNSILNVEGTLTLGGDFENDQPGLVIVGNTIIAGTSTLTGTKAVTFGGLTIESGSVLNIGQGMGEGNHVTVNGTLVNNAGISGLLLANDASLIETTGSVGASFTHIIGGDPSEWHLLSSPVTAQPIAPDFSGAGFFAWDEASQSFAGYGQVGGYPDWDVVNGGSDNFVPGQGYFTNYDNVALERVFSGALNQGTVSLELKKSSSEDETFHAFNLSGNPYPSSLDWKAASGWIRTDLEEVSTGDNNYAYWVWNGGAGNYGTFISDGNDESGTNGVSRYIAPKQGFWVKAAVNAGTFTMNDLARSHSTQEWLKQGDDEGPSLLKMRLVSDAVAYYDELVMEFTGKDGNVPKFFSSVVQAPEVYIEREGQPNSILRYASIPETAVPVSFKAGQDAAYTFMTSLVGLEGQEVQLEDKLTGIFTDLHKISDYNFISDAGFDSDRFKLHFNPVGLSESFNAGVKVYYTDNKIVINSKIAEPTAVVEVYDVRGNILHIFSRLDQGINHYPFVAIPGVYIVRIIGATTSSHKVSVQL